MIRFPALDGHELAGDLFEPSGPPKAVVVVAPAMAVRRRLYAAFARFLADAGMVVLVVDYRGVGDSRRVPVAKDPAVLHDWGELDLGGAVVEVTRRAPGAPLLWVGHSVGGQLMGLVYNARVHAALFIASQSAYVGHWRGLGRVAMTSLFHAVIPGAVRVRGYLPMRAFRQGEDLPRGVALEWARWARHPKYVLSYAETQRAARYATFAGKLRAYGFSDDSYAPRPAVEALLAAYPAAVRDLRWTTPAELGVGAVGHFGAFREPLRPTLWTEARDWLVSTL